MARVGEVFLIYINNDGKELERWVQQYNFPKLTIAFKGVNYKLEKLKYSGMYHDFDRVTVEVFDWSIADYARMTYRAALEKYGIDLATHKISPYCLVSVFVPSGNKTIFEKTRSKITQLFHQ